MKRALPVMVLTALVLLALWPLPATLGSAIIGHPTGDMPDHYWGTWWFGHELLDGRWPGWTDLTHYPQHLRFWHIDPVGALLDLPVRVLGWPLAFNLLVLFQVLTTALTASWAGRDLTGSRTAGVVSGVVVGASAYTLGLVHSGLSEFLGMAPLVLAIWLGLRATGRDPRGRPPPRGAALVTGLLLGLAGMATPYYAVFGGLVVVSMLPGRGWLDRLGPVLAAGLVTGALLAPYLLWISFTLSGHGAAVQQATAPGWTQGPLPATDLFSLLRPGPWYHPDTPAMGNPGILHISYLGWGALFLAGIAVHDGRGRSLWLPTLLALLLALGPTLSVDRHVISVAGHAIPLPFALLYLPGSPLQSIHHPYRFVAALLPLLGIMAALGSLRLPRWGRLAAAGVLVIEIISISPAPWPLATTPQDTPAIYAELPPGPVLDWPPDASTWNRSYLRWQVDHHRPIPYGVNVFLSAELRTDPLVGALLRKLDDPQERGANRDVPLGESALVTVNPGESTLGAQGFVALVVHLPALSDSEWARTRTRLEVALGEPLAKTDEAWAWEL